MNLDHQSTTITLDWDDITTRELKHRLQNLAQTPHCTSIYIRQSANSGYHVKAGFSKKVHVSGLRRRNMDDGRRLINDILNRPAYVHDILWDKKTVGSFTCHAGEWEKIK